MLSVNLHNVVASSNGIASTYKKVLGVVSFPFILCFPFFPQI
jgi:hypothetical protein